MPKYRVVVEVKARSAHEARALVASQRNPSIRRIVESDYFGTGKTITLSEDDDGKYTVDYAFQRSAVQSAEHPYRARFDLLDDARVAYERERQKYKAIAARPYERPDKRKHKEADYSRPYIVHAPDGHPEREGYKLGYDDGYAKLEKYTSGALINRAARLGFTSKNDELMYREGYNKGHHQGKEDKQYRRSKSYS